MAEFTLTINPNAQTKYFQYWLEQEYPDIFDGISQQVGKTYLSIFTEEVLTQQQRNDITAFYNALTVDDVIENLQCRIYTFLSDVDKQHKNCLTPPDSVDYIRSLTQRLHPVITDVWKGEVREITFFASVTVNPLTGEQTGTNPVVRENYVYTRNVDKIAQSRVMTIHWYRVNGTVHPAIKTREKYYTNEQAISEGVTRRQNIIDFMQIPLLGMLMQTIPCTYSEAVDEGGLFFGQYVVEVETYKFSPRQQTLQTAITNDVTFAWLDNVIDGNGTTIRDYIVDQLNY